MKLTIGIDNFDMNYLTPLKKDLKLIPGTLLEVDSTSVVVSCFGDIVDCAKVLAVMDRYQVCDMFRYDEGGE